MGSLAEHLRCPVCYEIPDGKVFQCKHGHAFCNQCSTQLKTCPQCRVHLGREKIRNRTLEQLLDVVEFSCPNKELGCERVLKRCDISSHLMHCKYEPFYFCKLLGFQKCSFNAGNNPCKSSIEILEHLRENHTEIQETRGTTALSLTYENFFTKANFLEKDSISVWTPHLLRLKEDEEAPALLILCQVSQATGNVGWICLGMSDSSSQVSDNHLVEFTFKGTVADQDLAPEMKWKTRVMGFKDIEKDLESYALRIPLCVINAFNMKSEGVGGDLQLRMEVVSPKDNKHQAEASTGSVTIMELASFICKSQLKPSGYTNEDEEDEEEIVYEDVFCNGCNQKPLINIRYKCLQCIDFDLCKTCLEKRKVHSHHVFARIQDLAQSGFFNIQHRLRVLKKKSSYI